MRPRQDAAALEVARELSSGGGWGASRCDEWRSRRNSTDTETVPKSVSFLASFCWKTQTRITLKIPCRTTVLRKYPSKWSLARRSPEESAPTLDCPREPPRRVPSPAVGVYRNGGHRHASRRQHGARHAVLHQRPAQASAPAQCVPPFAPPTPSKPHSVPPPPALRTPICTDTIYRPTTGSCARIWTGAFNAGRVK